MEEVILGLLTESDVVSRVAMSSVALTCTAPYTAPWIPFVTLGFLVRLFLEEVLVRLDVGTAGNAGCPGCQEVGVFCISVCPNIRVFCFFSTLLFFDSHCGVADIMRIDGCQD